MTSKNNNPLIILGLICLYSFLSANPVSPKIGVRLHSLLIGNNSLSKSISVNDDGNVRVIIVGEDVEPIVENAGGTIYTRAGSVITASLPLSKIGEAAGHKEVRRIALTRKYHLLNNLAAQFTHSDWVQQGKAPLSSAYTGHNVVVGIVDSGIDPYHGDFKNSDGTSRILRIWDQKDASGTGASGPGFTYDYGREWTKADIDQGLCTEMDMDGHGTHVAGTAAGTGLAIGNYQGMASGANLIIVNSDLATNSVLDAANYIFSLAESMGMPAVINMSFGNHINAHDGSDPEETGLDNLVSAKNGRIIVAAAGNEGEAGDWRHIRYKSSSGIQYTYFHAWEDGYVEMYIRIPNAFYSSLQFAIGVDESDYHPVNQTGGPLGFLGQSNWYTAQSLANMGGYAAETMRFNIIKRGGVEFYMESVSDSVTGVYVFITDNMTWSESDQITGLDLWRLEIKNGSPRIHAWCGEAGSIYPKSVPDATYQVQDKQYSVNAPANAKKVIAVGAYVNRNLFESYNGDVYSLEGTVGDLANFSSVGPATDGRIKPDIAAPGRGIISSLSSGLTAGEDYDMLFTVYGNQHILKSGTSMASPVVTGCVAQYLEQYPNASFEEVYAALTSSAQSDSYTGSSLPDANWGYGKVDIWQASLSTAVTSRNEAVPQTFSLEQNYPNPFNGETLIQYALPEAGAVRISAYDGTGRMILEKTDAHASAGSHTFQLAANDWPSGIYLLNVQFEKQREIRKMLLIK